MAQTRPEILRDYLRKIDPVTAKRYPYVVVTPGSYWSIPMTLEKARIFASGNEKDRIISIETGREVER